MKEKKRYMYNIGGTSTGKSFFMVNEIIHNSIYGSLSDKDKTNLENYLYQEKIKERVGKIKKFLEDGE